MRHGEVHNPEGLVYGALPGFVLSEHGRAQVVAAAGWLKAQLAGPPAILCSPLERTRETASLLHGLLGGEVSVEPRLTEAVTGLDGLPRRFAPAAYLGRWLDARTWAERESPAQVMARMALALRAALDQAASHGRDLVLVSHQVPIAMARVAAEQGLLQGDPRGMTARIARLAPWLFGRARCTPGSVTSLRLEPGEEARISYWEPAAPVSPVPPRR